MDSFGQPLSDNFAGQDANPLLRRPTKTGLTALTSLDALEASQPYLECLGSRDCGSGFSCIGNQCVKNEQSSTPGANSTPGDCDIESPDSESGVNCGSSGPQDCYTPSCDIDGGFDEPLDCCGADIVYRENQVTGVVEPTCDSGDGDGDGDGAGNGGGIAICNQYCTDYFQANAATRFGCSLMEEYGRGVGNICGSCESCGLRPGDEFLTCIPKLKLGEDAPCWCDNGARCDKCEPCQYQDSDLGDYGLCRPYEGVERNDSPDDCKECVEVTDPVCPCGVVLSGNFKACKVYGTTRSDPAEGLQLYLKQRCEEECKECLVETPAETCQTQTIYEDSANYPNYTTPPCPDEATCRVSGVIYVEGAPSFAVLFETCPNELFPGGCLCKPVDCNCNDECGECQECSPETATCVPKDDPGCTPPEAERPEGYDPDTNPDGVLGV